jgi:hypothetical protein
MLENEFVNRIVEEENFVALFSETWEIWGVENGFLGFSCEEVDYLLVFLGSV